MRPETTSWPYVKWSHLHHGSSGHGSFLWLLWLSLDPTRNPARHTFFPNRIVWNKVKFLFARLVFTQYEVIEGCCISLGRGMKIYGSMKIHVTVLKHCMGWSSQTWGSVQNNLTARIFFEPLSQKPEWHQLHVPGSLLALKDYEEPLI